MIQYDSIQYLFVRQFILFLIIIIIIIIISQY